MRHPLHRPKVCRVSSPVFIYSCSTAYLPSQRWTGKYFSRVPLKLLGVRVQLGHRLGQICPKSYSANADVFIVIDVTGIHDVNVRFFGCEAAPPSYIQLLRARWYPSTCVEPHTVATFRLLEHYQLLAANSKITHAEFYNSLAQVTDNTGLFPPPVSIHTTHPNFMCFLTDLTRIAMMLSLAW